MTQVITTSISDEFYELAKKHDISWAEALRIGLSIMLSDIGIKEYDNNLNLYRKMRLYQQQAEESSQKYYELKEKLEKQKQEQNGS